MSPDTCAVVYSASRQVASMLSRVRTQSAPFGNARLRMALWMPVRKLLHAVYSVARNRAPFQIQTQQARAA